MKKFFFFAVAMISAMVVNAATAKISFVSGQTVGDGKTWNEGAIKLKVTDTGGKVAIDANNCYFGDATTQTKFDARLKTGGKSSSSNNMTITVTNSGTLKIFARTGSSSATDRNIVITDAATKTEKFNKVLLESEAILVKLDGEEAEQKVFPVYSISLEGGKTYNLTYPVGSVNFYCFEYEYEGAEPEKRANTPSASVPAGTYYDPFKVGLTASDVDKIYYSVDNAGFQEYTDSIAFTEYAEYELKAFATLAGAKNSDTIIVKYTLEQFFPRIVFPTARETYSFADIQAEDLIIPEFNGALGTYTMDNVPCPSVKYLRKPASDGTDSTLTISFKSMPNVGIVYKNASDKADILKFGKNYAQIDGKNYIIEINNVQGGDTIVFVVTAKGSTAPEFYADYSKTSNLEPYMPEDEDDPLYNLELVGTQSGARVDNDYIGYTDLVYIVKEGKTSVSLKEIKGGYRLAKIQVGASRGAATGIKANKNTVKAVKTVKNGQLVIVRGDKQFNVLGAEL